MTASALRPAPVDPATTGSIVQRPGKTATAKGFGRDAVFASVAFPLKRLGAARKLAPSLAEIEARPIGDCARKSCSPAEAEISAAIARTANASIRDRLQAVNATVNRAIAYSRDIDLYGQADKWATPSETVRRASGDCEDYAILKMSALRSAGVVMKDMAVVVIFDQQRKVYHAVLSVAVGENYYILDNLRNNVVTDRKLPGYMPLFSMADGRNYFHGSRVSQPGKALASLAPFDRIAPGEGPEI